MSARSPRSGPPHRTSPQSDSSTPTAITPNPTSPASHASHTRHMASASSFSPLAPTRPGLQNIAIPIGSSDHSSSPPPKPPQLRTMRRMSTPGTQQTTADTSSLVSRRASKLGLDPSSSHGFLDDIVIGGECGLADGGKASGVQAPTSDDWIGHHLSIVLQHSFTVSSPHPIPSATTSGSLPSYSHSHPPNQFLNLCNPSVTEALRNKVSITSLSSFTTSTATDEEEDNETDDVEEADSQDSTASSCYFPNLKEADSAYSSQPRPFTPRSRPTSPLARQLQLPPLISEPPSAASRPELLQILNTWAFDANSLSPAQIRCSLHVLLSSCLKYTPGLIQQLLDLGVENPEKCLQSLVDNLEVAYDQRNAYHNFRHAVDVVQAVYTMLSYEGVVPPLGWVLLKESDRGHLTTPWVRKPVGRAGALLDEMTVWALLLAAAGHDVGHPGLSNAFMVNARTPIAYVFSDGAVLENFHRITFTRMLRDHGFGKVVDGHVGFRQVLVGAVLATDMGRHFPIVEELKRLASKWATSPEDDPNNTTDQLAAKVLITAGLIKCGDISNSTRPHHISLTWSSCLLNEWSRQAALEADLRLPISVVTLDPTEKRAQAKSQIGFTTLFVLPLFTVMEQLSPKAFRPFADNCRLGLKTWQKVVEHIDNALASRDGAASHRLSTSSATSLPAQSQSAPGTPEDPNSALSLDEPTLSPLSSYPPDGLFSQPIAMGSISSSFQPLSNDPDAHSTPKSRSAGWWGGPSLSLSSSDDINAEDSILSSISSSSISTLRDTNINAPVGDVNLTASSRSSPSNLCESGGGSTFNSVSNCELLSPHRGFNIQVSLSHPERQSSASSSSDEGKANSSNDDSSFSSLGSPSSPPRSPYFPSQRDSVSSSHNSAGGLKPHVVRNTRFDSPIHQSPIADQPSSTQRTRDHGMSEDFGLARRNGTRASLPLRKKSYSPHLVNQQVACAKGCGKVTVKCVKCAAESKLRMYRSLSLAKPPLQLRPEHVSGIRALLGQNSSFRQPAQVGPRHPGTFSPLAGLTEEQPPVSSPSRVTLSTEERSWPPYPFRPLGQLDH